MAFHVTRLSLQNIMYQAIAKYISIAIHNRTYKVVKAIFRGYRLFETN